MDTDITAKPATPDQRVALLVASISDYAIYMLDPNGYVNSWNAGAERFKGYTEPEILGKHFSCFYTPEDRDAGMPARTLATALENGRYESEGWRVRKDGTRFWASVVIDAIYDPPGQLVGYAKITRDITERVAAQQALRDSEQRFRLLVQGVTDYAIYMLSPGGEITNWNTGAERIKGYQRDEVVGTHFERFFTPEDRQAGIPARALATAASVGRFESEGLRLRKDGSRFWAHAVIDAIRDETGRHIGYAKITRDITEKVEAAASLEQARAALFQSQKMEALGQLTGGVAHDFNNLLGVISSGLDILNTAPPGKDTGRVLQSMRRAVERGALLTQQLLSFARQQPLAPGVYDLNKLMTAFEPVLRRACSPQIVLSFDLTPRLHAVSLDATRFEAALLNLAVNANDAMPQAGTLTVSSANLQLRAGEVGSLAGGDYVRICVADSGHGMPPDVMMRAFEPFFTTKAVGKGTGLGLSQVYGFITQSHGDVTIDTSPGAGTRINIYLPASAEAAREQQDAATPKETALIVEDDELLMAMAADLFEMMGYEVKTATNGSDALQVLERNPEISVLFTDVIMAGGINGMELADAARRRDPKLKILLASGYPLPALETWHRGLDDFTLLSKPYTLADLARHLRSPA